MSSKTFCSALLFGVLALGIVSAQQSAMTMKEVLRADLSAPGREVVQTYIVIPPGAASGGKHTHPGEEIAFVIEGSLRVEVGGEVLQTLYHLLRQNLL